METLSFQSSLDFCFYVVEFLPYLSRFVWKLAFLVLSRLVWRERSP